MDQSKNIVICSDGTGNTANKARGTNVFKIFEAVDVYGHTVHPSLTRQVAIYDDGVGTSNFKPLKLAGGAFGIGLGRNVRQLYAELARVYVPGDKIFLFGFSRGAFTVRTLAGLITNCGIIDRTKCRNDACLNAKVNEAYSEYRGRYRTKQRRHKMADNEQFVIFRNRHAVVDDAHAINGLVTIEFIGVWDTVDAVGLPFAGRRIINNYIYPYKFPDHKLSKQVKKACHALAIDDERLTFHPEIWDEEGEKDGRIEQVWFPGAHSNVGGGYPKQGLSLVSLYWMMKKAKAAGLRFSKYDWTFVRDHQHPFDKLYDSRAFFALYYRYKPRDIAAKCLVNHTFPKIHISAFERIVQNTEGYAPGNIPTKFKIEVTELHLGNLHGITSTIGNGLAPIVSLLDHTRFWIHIRQGCHLGLISLTVMFVVLTVVYSGQGIKGLLALFSGNIFTTLFSAIKSFPPMAAFLLSATGLLLIVATIWGRQKMKWLYSDAWYRLHPTLQQAMDGHDVLTALKEGTEELNLPEAPPLCDQCHVPAMQRWLNCWGWGRN